MQTPDAHATPAAAPDHGDDAATPAVDVLLRQAAHGDRASFSAFYDATVPWVHGMAAAMFASRRDAAEATAQTYLAAWEEAPQARLDLSDQDDAAHRERHVFTWLEVLAHRVMAGLLRGGSVPGPDRPSLPDQAGPGGAGAPGVPGDLVGHVSPEAFDAVRLAWLGGQTDAQVAERLGLDPAAARTLLRDGVRQLVTAHRTLATGTHAVAAPALVGAPLATSTGEDIAAGRGAELADLAALHALDAASHEAVSAAVQHRGPGDVAVWRSRVSGARRAVTWAFRGEVAEPPSALLDEVLRRLPAAGAAPPLVSSVEETAPREPGRGARTLKTGLLALLALAVLVLGAWTAWEQFSRPGIVHRVSAARDLFTTTEHPTQGGGTVQAFLSKRQDSGYLKVNGMPQLPKGHVYQVWLHPKDGTAPASLGRFDAGGFAEPLTFRGLDRFAAVSVTVEPSGGSEVPTQPYLTGLDLDPAASIGPQYGGRPSTKD